MMLGGSKSKLSKYGENLEKVMSGLFFFKGVGSTLLVEIKSFFKFIRLIKVSCQAHLIHCFFQLINTT